MTDTSSLPNEVLEAFSQALADQDAKQSVTVHPKPMTIHFNLDGLLRPMTAAALLWAASRLEQGCPDRNGTYDLCHCDAAPLIRDMATELAGGDGRC